MSDHFLRVNIVTPQQTAFEGEALAVTVPGSKSAFQVLYNHAPIISSLDVGVLKVQDQTNNVRIFASKEGFIEVLKNQVSIVVNEIIDAVEIDLAKAQADLERAKNSHSNGDRLERVRAKSEQRWAEARLSAIHILEQST